MTKKRSAKKAPTQNSGRSAAAMNLKPFPKGTSGNPGGRPSTKWIRDFFDGIHDKKTGETRRLTMLKALYRTALNGRHRDHGKVGLGLMAYDFGRPVAMVEVTGKDGGPIESASVVATMTSEEKRRRLQELMVKAGARLPVPEEEPANAADDPGSDDEDAELDDE